MKKWIFIITFIMLLSIAGSVFIYTSARAPLKSAQLYAIDRAEAEAGITSIEKFYLYNGTETFYVIIGDRDGNKTVVWIPEDDKQEILIKNMADGISENEALSKLKEEEAPAKILGARLGMEKSLPVWELSYLDKQSKLNYYYIHFDSGKWWRKIENL